MAEATKTKTMVELVLKQDSEFPKLCVAASGEMAKNPMILTDVIIIKYPGPDFASSDGSDFREDAIRRNAPSNANAYLGRRSLTERAVMCGDSYLPIVYFHIDEEQADKSPRLKKRYIYRPDPSEIPDGESE